MMEEPANPTVPFEWIEKTYPVAFRLGRFRLGRIPLRTKHLWTAFPVCRNTPDLPPVAPGDLEGVDAVYIPGFPVSRNFPIVQFLPGLIRYMSWRDTRFLVAISGTFDSYLQSRSSGMRRQLSKQIRRWRDLAGQEPTLREFRGLIQLREFYSIAGPLSRMTWQGKAGAGLEEFESSADILRIAETDQARGYILFSANQPAAFQLSYVQGTTLAFSQIGYDPAYAQFSPGTTLLYLLLEKQFAEGQMEFCDLMEGSAWAYKARLATLQVPSMRFLFFRRSIGALLLVLTLCSLRKLEQCAAATKKFVSSLLARFKKPLPGNSGLGNRNTQKT